jgi:ribonuclease HII
MSSAEHLSVAEIRAQLSAADGSALSRLIAKYDADPRAGVASACDSARSRLKRTRAERRRVEHLYDIEHGLHEGGFAHVAGIDEVGRGALAGPLTAAAVILPETPMIEGLDDSKKLTPQRREELAVVIRATAVCVSVAHVSAQEIDAIGIAKALRRAMGLAIAGLSVAPDHVVVDGLPMGVHDAETAVVKGDSIVAAVSAASIVAKVARDALMTSLAAQHPAYGFDVNKGYGTSAHMHAIDEHGMSSLHRRSFHIGGGTSALF